MPDTESGITIQINLPAGIEKLIPKVSEFLEQFDGDIMPGQNQKPSSEIMTADDVCEEFKLNRTKLYALTGHTGPGSIPRFKIGRELRFKRSELINWFDRQKVE